MATDRHEYKAEKCWEFPRRLRRRRAVQSVPVELVAEPEMTRRELVQKFVDSFQIDRGREPTFKETLTATRLPKATVSTYRRLALAA